MAQTKTYYSKGCLHFTTINNRPIIITLTCIPWKAGIKKTELEPSADAAKSEVSEALSYNPDVNKVGQYSIILPYS